ncbi:M15 family metallopeptidase [Grimontia sp. NTOU-MAR1]|uniref:M15 family metallopeptidase n=1 Tax=Grimontia sp. NTOU-MAR1 TaxID=3111011 RepID=UPI002DBFA709|nr:M15 family metallopeptidase [Grimontia sp. NTOU-MAR1]WRV97380.1 M15 family metallopeptidase [Grimontia sp. NTOU-MAR1]
MSWTLSSLTGQSQDHLCTLTDGLMLHKEVQADFLALQSSAEKAGFELTIASSFRDFNRQQMIWDNKFNGLRPMLDGNGNPLDTSQLNDDDKVRAILRWSALPGASRHHWGTDIDIYARNLLPEGISIQLEPWEYLTGHQKPFFDWLLANMKTHGFYLPYREDRGGVAFEPWHISHIPTTQGALDILTPDALRTAIASSNIAGRETVLNQLDWIYSQYVSNVCEV